MANSNGSGRGAGAYRPPRGAADDGWTTLGTVDGERVRAPRTPARARKVVLLMIQVPAAPPTARPQRRRLWALLALTVSTLLWVLFG